MGNKHVDEGNQSAK